MQLEDEGQWMCLMSYTSAPQLNNQSCTAIGYGLVKDVKYIPLVIHPIAKIRVKQWTALVNPPPPNHGNNHQKRKYIVTTFILFIISCLLDGKITYNDF